MLFRRTLPLAAALSLAGLAEARAQQAAPPAQQMSPCVEQFLPLRGEVEKRFLAAKGGIDRKAPAVELCRLFTQFTEAESKMIKYAEENGAWCGFPPEVLSNMKSNQLKSTDFRKRACTAAQSPARPAGPSLSDALVGPVPDANTTKTGRGIFDSLTGNPLAR
jgi:hypothetical protein